MKAVTYARVSSTGDRQSTERQILDLVAYADKNGITVEKTFEEHISGARKNKDRFILNECLAYAVENGIDIILISELSRLGRNVDEVLANIRFCKDNHLNIYFQKEAISIYDPEGKENPYLTIMIAVLGTCAQLERDAIYFRLSSGRRAGSQVLVVSSDIRNPKRSMRRHTRKSSSFSRKDTQYAKLQNWRT